ncbi:MAG: CarboxypepD reg-like domain, partial [Labilithrix sp.]|nr:CarboxypepD reg-like domain [Labilithrix sp.]
LASMAWLAASADEKVPRRPAGPSPTVGRWGAIVGDPTNLDPVVGARVSLEGTDHTGTTNERGELVLDGLAGGRFTIVIEHPEYAPYRFENALVRAGRLTFTNYWLQPAPTR